MSESDLFETDDEYEEDDDDDGHEIMEPDSDSGYQTEEEEMAAAPQDDAEGTRCSTLQSLQSSRTRLSSICFACRALTRAVLLAERCVCRLRVPAASAADVRHCMRMQSSVTVHRRQSKHTRNMSSCLFFGLRPTWLAVSPCSWRKVHFAASCADLDGSLHPCVGAQFRLTSLKRTDLEAVVAHAGDRDDAEEWQAPTSLPVRIEAAIQLFIRILGSCRLTRSDAMQCT